MISSTSRKKNADLPCAREPLCQSCLTLLADVAQCAPFAPAVGSGRRGSTGGFALNRCRYGVLLTTRSLADV
jgi:hypothetical protein